VNGDVGFFSLTSGRLVPEGKPEDNNQ
jgi:hypothetical protein